jgi:hypothetical protein
MATSRKTLNLDTLQLTGMNYLTSNNRPYPSSFVLYSVGNGSIGLTSISSLTNVGYTTVSVPGQAVLNSSNTNNILNINPLSSELILSTNFISSTVFIGIPSLTSTIQSTINANQASTNFNFLVYPNIHSSIYYQGRVGLNTLSTLATTPQLSNSGTAQFSSLQYNFSTFSRFLNPNASSRMFIEYYPNFTFSPVITPSSISSIALYPEGNSSIKNVLALSSHLMYVNATGSNVPINQSGVQQYINIDSTYPYGLSSFVIRPTSNYFIQPIQFELDTLAVRSNFNFSLVHYISDGTASVKTVGGIDTFRTGLERTTFNINNSSNDRNIVYVTIANTGNQF